MNEDIRWKQRFNNFTRALKQLKFGIEIMQQRVLSIIEEQGVIQVFEYNHELAWNVLKDYLEYQGITGIIGSKGTTREAFKTGLIESGEIWMDMIKSRNLSTHTYNEDTAQKLIEVIPIYYQEFLKLQVIMNGFLEKTDL